LPGAPLLFRLDLGPLDLDAVLPLAVAGLALREDDRE
jgi:hypothetical protein